MDTITVDPIADPEAAHLQDFHGNPGAGSGSTNGKVAEVLEADGLRATVLQRMQEKFREVMQAEATIAKGLYADAVRAVANVLALPEAVRPKYAKIAELILTAMGREVKATSQVRLSDETLQTRTGKGNAYKQYAMFFVDLARWDMKMYTKPEIKHQERNPGMALQITYDNQVFASPVDALQGGVPWSTCHRLFRNLLRPSFTDLSILDATKSRNVASNHAKKEKAKGFTLPLRMVDDDGNEKRGRVNINVHEPLITGTVIGLLEKWGKPVPQKSFDLIIAALELVRPKATV